MGRKTPLQFPNTVFFNLFSEAEPFAAILLLTEPLGDSLRPEGPKFEAEGGE